MFVGEILQYIKKRKDKVANIEITHVYIRGSGPEAYDILQKCNLLPHIPKKNLTFDFVTGQNNILTPTPSRAKFQLKTPKRNPPPS